jgi:hypothetical protein
VCIEVAESLVRRPRPVRSGLDVEAGLQVVVFDLLKIRQAEHLNVSLK